MGCISIWLVGARYFWQRNVKKTFMESPQEKKFIPKGALAFFILLVILTLLFWYCIYLLMIARV